MDRIHRICGGVERKGAGSWCPQISLVGEVGEGMWLWSAKFEVGGDSDRFPPMTEQERAAENLGVIRSLMERATIYRAISWATAFFGGILAVILSTLLYFREDRAIGGSEDAPSLMSEEAWIGCWLFAMLITGVFNSILIARKSAISKATFFSPGLKMALRGLVPPMLAGGVLGMGHVLSEGGTAAGCAAIWVICYGLSLLATIGIAPRSIRWLGWIFLLSGVVAYLYVWSDDGHPLPFIGSFDPFESPMLEANLIMGICFGVFHLIYGVIVMQLSCKGRTLDAPPRDD